MINNDSTGYPKLNLADHDTVYWAVTNVDSSDHGVSLYISRRGLRGDKDTVVKYNSVIVEPHPGLYPNKALAQWLWSDSDETAWGSCKKDACCK